MSHTLGNIALLTSSEQRSWIIWTTNTRNWSVIVSIIFLIAVFSCIGLTSILTVKP